MFPKTLRGKFSVVYVGLALLAALVGLAGVWNTFRIERSVDSLMTANYKSIDAVYRMIESIERQDSGMLISLVADRKTGLMIFTENGNEFLRWFDIERSNVTDAGEPPVIERLQANYSQYQEMIFTLSDRMASGLGDAGEYYSATVLPKVETIKAECRELITINERAMFAGRQAASDGARDSMFVLALFSLSAAAAGFFIARYFILLFLKPIKSLSDSIVLVREGDLYQKVEVRSNDEAGRLASEFNSMTKRLQDYEASSVGSLMTERNKTMAIVKSISDPLLVLDENWRILLINDACGRFFNLDEAGVAGRHFLEAIRDGALFESIEKLADGAPDPGGRILSLQKDGERFFHLTVTRVNDPGNHNNGVIVALQDVTGLKELERVRTDFLAAISHEFKTPLTGILMASSMLMDGSVGALTAEQADTVATVQQDGERLLGLVNELLELMRIESGNEIYRIEPCSMRGILAVSLHDCAENARRRGVRLVDRLEEGLPEVAADFEKTRWVLNNLIGNALKHTGEGDAVTVCAERRGRFLSVSVQDTGRGIPPEHLERIFEKFVRVDNGGIDVSGTGLGLSVSREIIRGQGGGISASSEAGRGSTFTFTLPLAAGEEGG